MAMLLSGFASLGDLMQAGTQSRQGTVGRVIRLASGNFLEMYDFMVFGYYAPAIARAFFPVHSEFLSLLLTFMTFGAGFLMRPLGAVVLGAYADRHGRRAGLILTLQLMAVGTMLLALVPSYGTIGIVAPVLVVCGRLVQGFSAGVELGAVSVYLAEIATPGHRGFYVSWQSASQQVAVMVAAVLGVVLLQFLTPAQMSDWGWRIPLLIGCAIVPLLFFLRRALTETEEFLAAPKPDSMGAVFGALLRNWPVVTAGMMMVTLTTVMFYLITAYTPTFGSTVLHLSSLAALVVTLCVGASNFVILPLMGAVSDRIGRRPVLIACALLALVSSYPAISWLVAAPSFARLLAVELWLSLIYASYNGAMVASLTEIVPPRLRTAGFSMSYSLATAIFGGFTPAVCTWLIHATGNRAAPGLWVALAGLVGLAGILLAGRVSQRD
jgi:MFS family permease